MSGKRKFAYPTRARPKNCKRKLKVIAGLSFLNKNKNKKWKLFKFAINIL